MNQKILYSTILGILVSVPSIFSEETAEPSVYDKIWDAAKLVDNNDANVLQSLAFAND